jgi:hypothetical protein
VSNGCNENNPFPLRGKVGMRVIPLTSILSHKRRGGYLHPSVALHRGMITQNDSEAGEEPAQTSSTICIPLSAFKGKGLSPSGPEAVEAVRSLNYSSKAINRGNGL